MSSELIAILVTSGIEIIAVAGLWITTSRGLVSVQEQLRRNLALETQFQKWNAQKLDGVVQCLDEILQMLQKGKI